MLPIEDRFYFNQYFDTKIELHLLKPYLSSAKLDYLRDFRTKGPQLIGAMGKKAFHLFDRVSLTWLCSLENLGYNKFLEV